MNLKIYIETTIPSYLTSQPSRDAAVAAHQRLTIEWWRSHRHRFDLYISDVVLREVARGDVAAAARRLAELEGVEVLGLDENVRELARRFVENRLIPAEAVEDALHVAVATAHGMDFLLTWNCRHIANPEVAKRLQTVCRQLGYYMPTLCTPEQLMGH
jgi:predicted nucleic acid-binding protein